MLKLLILILCLYCPVAIAGDLQLLTTNFCDADIHKKYAIVDSLLAADSIPGGFFRTLMTTDDFRPYFETFDIYHVLRMRTAERLFNISNPDIANILKEYYYGGIRSRKLDRPTTYAMKYDWQHELCRATDKNGTIWAVTNIWWFGCRDDLWLISKNNESDSIWAGPWFTGICQDHSEDKNAYYLNPCRLEFIKEELHLIIVDQQIDTIISPAILTADWDKDGLYDYEEIRFTTNPDNDDSDSDGIIDGEDMNPIAPANENLSDVDMARLAMFKNFARNNYAYSLYVLPVREGKKLEYDTSSPNSIILTLNPEEIKRHERCCPGPHYPNSGLAVNIRAEKISDDRIDAFISFRDIGERCELERKNGIWLISRFLGTVRY